MPLGLGVGLLASNRLGEAARRRAGWALVAIGVLSTIPLGMKVAAGTRRLAAT